MPAKSKIIPSFWAVRVGRGVLGLRHGCKHCHQCKGDIGEGATVVVGGHSTNNIHSYGRTIIRILLICHHNNMNTATAAACLPCYLFRLFRLAYGPSSCVMRAGDIWLGRAYSKNVQQHDGHSDDGSALSVTNFQWLSAIQGNWGVLIAFTQVNISTYILSGFFSLNNGTSYDTHTNTILT